MKPTPNGKVISWLDQQESTQLFITTITIAEISYGLHILSVGRRRNFLENAFNKAIIEAFKYRILTFDEQAADWYGKIMGYRKKIGRSLPILDGQIAAIARTHRATLVTRNVRDFTDCHIDLVNPFT